MNTLEVPDQIRNIIDSLNPEQASAALHADGPLVVFAGAGSGKTRIITARIALLVANGVRPSQILAVTFTNKAAREMRERVENFSPSSQGAHIATFHAACARWLREFAPYLGFKSDFTIYDDKDALNALKTILKELNIKDDDHSPQDYKYAIGRAKTYGMLPADAEQAQKADTRFFPPLGVSVYRRYQEYLANCNAMDFSDLMMNMLLLLRNSVDARQRLQKRYKYILVDEYQDTNPTQFALVSHLLGPEQNLFVVGDDDQSIYSWRGADPSNIIEFNRHYPSCVEVRLEQNYRCTKSIVDAAAKLIANNQVRAEKTLWTANEEGSPITFHQSYDGELEALYLADSIESEKADFSYKDVAIFYRTNAQSRQIEDCLLRQQIPYKLYGSLKFYERAEIKDILSYLRLIYNEQDDMAFKRIINVPTRGVGKKAVEQVEAFALQRDCSMMEACQQLVAESYPRLSSKLALFLNLFKEIKTSLKDASFEQVLDIILDATEYKAYTEKKFPEQAIDKIANLHELGAALSEYSDSNPEATISNWLQETSLNESDQQEEIQGVTIMTLHSAKGLEFPRVYITGVEDGLIPHSNSLEAEVDIEEERRLFYVGITRACKKLSLLAAKKRRVYNNWLANTPSRFLKEIGLSKRKSAKKIPEKSPHYVYDYDYNSQGSGKKPFSDGSYVSHPTYGKGVVEALEQEFGNWKVTVNFRDFGKRIIASRFLKQIAYLD